MSDRPRCRAIPIIGWVFIAVGALGVARGLWDIDHGPARPVRVAPIAAEATS
jgi:hypothetical protein